MANSKSTKDDASNDGTQEMLREYSKLYPNKFILKFSEQNQGITKNSNLAHFACSGKYIAWMGGDDLMLPGKIKKQVEYMEKNHNCSICYHDLDVFNSKTNETLFIAKSKYSGDASIIIRYGTVNGACSTMIRSNKAPKNGFNERISWASDWLYWCETLLNGGSIEYIQEVLGRYRRHDSNITSTNKKIILDHLDSCNILLMQYPKYYRHIVYRYSNLIRNLDTDIHYYKASFLLGLNYKGLIKSILYYITLGKMK